MGGDGGEHQPPKPPETGPETVQSTAKEDVGPPNTKPELDEFGLPLRPKRPRISFHEDDSDETSADETPPPRESQESRESQPISRVVEKSERLEHRTVDVATEKTVTTASEPSSPARQSNGSHSSDPPTSKTGPAKASSQDTNGTTPQDDSLPPGTEDIDKEAPAPVNGHINGNEKPSAVGGEDDVLASPLYDKADEYADQEARRKSLKASAPTSPEEERKPVISEFSHQRILSQDKEVKSPALDDEWQEMPAYAPFDIYNDDNKLVAREAAESDDDEAAYSGLGGAGKGYTRVTLDEDAQSVTSLEDHTAYLFKELGTGVVDEDEDSRDALAQMQATKDLLTEAQRIAYVGLTRLAILELQAEQDSILKTKGTRKAVNTSVEAMKMWGQKMMVRLYGHMDLATEEQIMIEQLGEHGVKPSDMSPILMQNARVKNPVLEEDPQQERVSASSGRPSESPPPFEETEATLPHKLPTTPDPSEAPPAYDAITQKPLNEKVQNLDALAKTENVDIDIRWTVLCDLFLVLVADSIYDARSRQLLERVASFLSVTWLEICRFERRVTEALEMQEAANKENWNEGEHIAERSKSQRTRRLMLMGMATVGGGLIIGLSAGLLAPVIGAGLAAGFTTIGVAGTNAFLVGAGGAAIITSTGLVAGGTVGVRAAQKRGGAVQTFEYRPLHNNKRTNLIITVSGWMTGKVDDVRLPFSTVDSVMGDIYSIHWEPEMLRSMGDTINILANEALTQTIQQVLGMTILTALMAAIQIPVVLTKLSYLIDNPWSNSLARAHLAGLIFADSLIDRNLGTRPVTLVGFSLGAKVIFSCLQELVAKGAFGLVQNVYLFGSPIVSNRDEYLKAKSVVSGRFVNGYATNDWILGYLFRATGGGGVSRVSGLTSVQGVDGIENVDVTEDVPGHMAYRAAMPKLLRKVGWSVESDEFTEIEDPDPDNHEKRQRELINEIEEARKGLEEGKKSRWRFGMFRTKKGRIEKKSWETYDERAKAEPSRAAEKDGEGGVLFDVDAIRAEAAELAARTELAAEGFDVRELESTMPPMKLDLSGPGLSGSPTPEPAGPVPPPLKTNKSYNDSLRPSSAMGGSAAQPKTSSSSDRPLYDDWDHYDRAKRPSQESAGRIHARDSSVHSSPRMSFVPSSPPRAAARPASSHRNGARTPSRTRSPTHAAAVARSPSPSPSRRVDDRKPVRPVSVEHNAWADDGEDDLSQEKEVKMTFE